MRRLPHTPRCPSSSHATARSCVDMDPRRPCLAVASPAISERRWPKHPRAAVPRLRGRGPEAPSAARAVIPSALSTGSAPAGTC
uniref:Uncharacterized protein n=1 Tax=Setaria viridis TaxID=4556 RepID=A0A4U6T5C1_SETVI|nr:hypothetical protein SEVIR_9G376800v2 [Setaria viridis]